jgi:hypothetical protein
MAFSTTTLNEKNCHHDKFSHAQIYLIQSFSKIQFDRLEAATLRADFQAM